MPKRTRLHRKSQSTLFIGENSEGMEILQMFKDLIKQCSGPNNNRKSRQGALRYICQAAKR